MASSTNLYIKIKTIMDRAGLKGFMGDLKLLKSTFRAIFRTTAVVAFFMLFRKVSQIISETIEKTKQLISENVKLQFTSQQAASIMASGGKETAKNFRGVIDASRQLAIETGTAANKISEGLVRGAMAGFQLKNNISLVRKTLQMATIAGVDFRTSMSGVIGVTRAFGVNTKQIATYTDVMTKAFTKANMTFSDFITSMKYVAPIAVAAFGSVKDTFVDTASALMTLSNVGLDASKSGVYLRGTMLKLMGSSNKVTTAFAKYGINLYEGTGKAKGYMNTMIAGQKVMAKYYDEVTRLKSEQFKLVLAGKEGTDQYKKVKNELGAASKKLAEYNSGLKMVNEQFRMAGGQLKPFHKIIEQIHKDIPHAAEVLTKIFGVRGGAGIATILTKFPDFEKNIERLNKVWEESKKGKSILHDIFVTMLNTALVKWEQIKNTVWGIFSVIIQSGLKASAPLLNVILEGVTKLYEIVKNNKGVFEKMFKDIVDSYIPEIKKFFGTDLVNLVKKINVFSPKWKAPIYESKLNEKTGKYEATKTGEQGGQTPGDRMFVLAKSLSSYIVSSFVSILKNHKEDFVSIGRWIGLGLENLLKTLTAEFKMIGANIGQGAVEYMIGKLPFGKYLVGGQGESAITKKKIKQEEMFLNLTKPAGNEKPSEAYLQHKTNIESLQEQLKMFQSGISMGNWGKYNNNPQQLANDTRTTNEKLGINMGGESAGKVQKAAAEVYTAGRILDAQTIITMQQIGDTIYRIQSYMGMVNGKLKKLGEGREVATVR